MHPTRYPRTMHNLRRWLARLERKGFSYPEVGATLQPEFPDGYDHDLRETVLGQGSEAFHAAVRGLRTWRQFPPDWTRIRPDGAQVVPEQTVAVSFRLLGLWWVNACRVIYVIDEPRRFGFAYGTLPPHMEMGEELFLIEWLDDDSIVYTIEAFSRPRSWLAKIGYFYARRQQRRFGRESAAELRRLVDVAATTPTPGGELQ